MKPISYLLILGLCFQFLACQQSKENEKKATEKYTVTNPVIKDTSILKEYTAQIQSEQNVEIRAQVKGYLEGINVDEGQHVKAGQVLFTIMPKEYEAKYQKAKAEYEQAELEWKNTKSLADKNIVSDSELAISKAKLDMAKAELSEAELYLGFTKIKAPFDGCIDRLKFKKGSLIDEGTLLTTLSNNRDVYAYFNVSESEYLDYKKQISQDKQGVSLILANGETHKYKGRIETIEGEFDNSTGNISFRAKFPNPDNLLKHGETGKVVVTVPVNKALLIPQKSTFEIQDKIYAYVLQHDNKLKAVNITVRQAIPNLYILNSGISPNDKILLDGVQNVKDGDKIQPVYVNPTGVMAQLQLIKQG